MGLFSGPRVAGLAREALDFAREAARDAHPNEFMGMLRADRADRLGLEALEPDELVVTDVLVIPATEASPVEARVRENLVPNDGLTVGSVHSHPNGVLRPSDADRAAFGLGALHVILGAPYEETDWRAFDREGEPRELSILDVDLEPAGEFFDFDQADIDRELGGQDGMR